VKEIIAKEVIYIKIRIANITDLDPPCQLFILNMVPIKVVEMTFSNNKPLLLKNHV